MEKVMYIQIGDHLFYSLQTGKVVCINTQKETFRSLKSLPTAYVNDFQIIDKETYNKAATKVGLNLI